MRPLETEKEEGARERRRRRVERNELFTHHKTEAVKKTLARGQKSWFLFVGWQISGVEWKSHCLTATWMMQVEKTTTTWTGERNETSQRTRRSLKREGRELTCESLAGRDFDVVTKFHGEGEGSSDVERFDGEGFEELRKETERDQLDVPRRGRRARH